MAEKEDEKYEVLEKIGQGSFGIIRKVRLKSTKQILCRKEICYSRMSEKEKNQLHAELRILESLRHPNIVEYCHREHLKNSHDLYLYMEYCGNGDLGGYVKKLKDRNQYAEEEFVWAIFAQLVSALFRCHYGEDPPKVGEEGKVRNGKTIAPLQSKEGHRVILHRDLKPENVFLGEDNAVKLGDFGLSKIMQSHDFASTYVGTPFYMSPEICAAERYSHHSDIWSLGCIIYELATRCVPFDARHQVELVLKIRNAKAAPLPKQYSRDLQDVISWCMKVNPKDRPDTAQLLNVFNIRLARMKLQQVELGKERDAAMAQIEPARKQILELQKEVQKLKEQGKKVEMEWHARATLAIDQRVHEQVEAKKQELLKQFNGAVDQRAEEKLTLHLASLPASHGLSGGDSTHVRSRTPPPGKAISSFTTTGTRHSRTSRSSVSGEALNDSALDTDLTSLSLHDELPEDDISPLIQRTKPPQKGLRKAFGRAQTFANCNLNPAILASPHDVQMADPSPMPPHVAPMSIKGLSLSPRKERFSAGRDLRRDIFSTRTSGDGHDLRPHVPGESQGYSEGFADDDSDLEDDPDVLLDLETSPSRPTSGLSNLSAGEPFKANGGQIPKPTMGARPSLGRQKTMPIQPTIRTQGVRPSIFSRGVKSPEREKENRPPSSHARNTSALPTITASPKRKTIAPIAKDPKALTPSRKAPPPPSAGASRLPNFTAQTQGNIMSSPNRGVQGRTLVQLQQARSQPVLSPPDSDFESDFENVAMAMGGPKLLPSPAKWDPIELGDEMPSPFLAKRMGNRVMMR